MKKNLAMVILSLVTVLSCVTSCFAGGIVNRQSLSMEYLRTFSRNGATDAADIAYYNPAGIMEMSDGTRLNVSGTYTNKVYANTLDGNRYESDLPSIGPAVYAMHKENQWAVFGGFNIPGGGGEVEFDQGSATTFLLAEQIKALTVFDTTESMNLDGNSYYYGYFAGGAYEIFPKVGLACGLRYVDAAKEADGTVVLSVGGNSATPFNVKYDQTANGWGGILGLNLAPIDGLNVGLRYETPVKLDFETNVKNDDTGGAIPGITEGAELTEDLPGLLGLGVFYQIIPDLQACWSTTYYFEKAARWEGRLSGQGDSWETALAFEYDFTRQIRASLGYMYTETGIHGENILPEAPELDVRTFCGGVRYTPWEHLAVNLGIAKSIYDSEDTVMRGYGVSFDKMAPALGMGVDYRF
jgi:long-chain fatty acid transport protein